MNYCSSLLLMLAANALANPSGAPSQACKTMVPGHGYDPQSGNSPFTVVPLVNQILENTFVPISLSSWKLTSFKGYLIMAFDEQGNGPIGQFNTIGGKVMSCLDGTDNAVTHTSNDDKTLLIINWIPPEDFTGPVYFKATIVKNVTTCWVGVTSEVVNVVSFMPSSSVKCDCTSFGLVLLIALMTKVFTYPN